jgi:hypothetical protein
MTVLNLLTPHPGGLDYDLDQNNNYPTNNKLSEILTTTKKKDKVLVSTAE